MTINITDLNKYTVEELQDSLEYLRFKVIQTAVYGNTVHKRKLYLILKAIESKVSYTTFEGNINFCFISNSVSLDNYLDGKAS